MDKTYGYDETELILSDDSQYAYESDDYTILEHVTEDDGIVGYAILFHEDLIKDDLSADEVEEYFSDLSGDLRVDFSDED